jgi:hypothetical protein
MQNILETIFAHHHQSFYGTGCGRIATHHILAKFVALWPPTP